MNEKFTAGPWSVGSKLETVNELGALGRDIFSTSPLVDEGDTGICLVAIGANEFVDPRREANARLIAAAPDMIDALDIYADQLCEGWCEQSWDRAHFNDCGGCLARRVAAQARSGPKAQESGQ